MTVAPVDQHKILVVEDDPAVRELFQDVLETENYSVHMATDGEQALAQTRSLNPDLILLDIRMPKLDGVSFCKAIRDDKQTQDIPIIFITAYNSLERREEAIAAGGDDFLGKPFKTDELIIRIRAMLNARSIADPMERIHQYLLSVRKMRADLPPSSTS
jgi:DNA-binding response OmpR family regulator